MRAPITSVVKHVSSKRNACSQYRCGGSLAAYTGMGRMYSTVEEAIGGVDSDMRFLARDSSGGLPLRCYYGGLDVSVRQLQSSAFSINRFQFFFRFKALGFAGRNQYFSP